MSSVEVRRARVRRLGSLLGATVIGVGAVIVPAGAVAGASGATGCFDVASYAGDHPYFGIAAGDLDGDGDQDLVATRFESPGAVVVFVNAGDGTFSEGAVMPFGQRPRDVAVADLDADGDLDIVASGYDEAYVGVFLGDGTGAFADPVTYTTDAQPGVILVGHYDAGETADLAVANYSGDTVSILLGAGGGTFGAAQGYTVWGNPVDLGQGDFDGDGDTDLAVSSNNGGMVAVLPNNGDGTFGWFTENWPGGPNPRGPAVADFDGDGFLDLAASTFDGPSGVTMLTGAGDGTFTMTGAYEVPGNVHDLVAAHLNGDGALDLVTANYGGGSVGVLSGNGDGTFKPSWSIPVAAAPVELALADVDGNGSTDVVASSWDGNAINVLRNGAPCSVQAGFSYSPETASVFDKVQFTDRSSDPGGAAITKWKWTFGDGDYSGLKNPRHRYAKDGSYTVTLRVWTRDGRSATTSRTVDVQTHDVGIVRIEVPTSARAGEAITVTVKLANRFYYEEGQVDLYLMAGDRADWVDGTYVGIPAAKATTVDVTFTYQLTQADLDAGRLSFQATLNLWSATDANTANNVLVSLPVRVQG